MLKQGINRGLSNSLYHGDQDYLSSSVIKTAFQSMGKYKDKYLDGNQRSPSDAMRLGSAFHCLVLEPEKFKEEFPVFDNKLTKLTTKVGKAAFAEFKTMLKNKHDYIKATEIVQIEDMARSVKRYSVADDLFKNGEPELSVATRCSLTGLDVKVRPDWLDTDKKFIVDLKSAKDPEFNKFMWNVSRGFNYGLSASMYCHVMKEITGDDYDFYWVVTGNLAPYDTYVYKASKECLDMGMKQYLQGCHKIKEAKITGEYFAQSGIQEMVWKG